MRPRHYALSVAFVVLAVLILGIGPVAGAQPAPNPPRDPQPLPHTGIPWLDSVYFGATPPQATDGPVLVFVHGYGGLAQHWWTENPCGDVNDMYVMAYQAGYRTAFVNLGGDNGLDTGSMWENGRMLSWQLAAIAAIYDVDKLDIVAHSKGGIDAQTAVAHYQTSDIVSNVFTLGTPHQGSELADLVYSLPARWLMELVGLRNEATYTLQTGYMRVFRALTDPKVENEETTYYTAAGTGAGPLLSMLWLTGLYLSGFGPNDGAVTVASTELAGARTLFIEPYHHYDIALGHIAFPWIDAALHEPVTPITHTLYLPIVRLDSQQPHLSPLPGSDNNLHTGHLSGPPTDVAPAPFASPDTQQSVSPAPLDSDIILRGGRLSGPITETVPIEPGALTVTFNLFVSDETVTATLTGPDGQTRPWANTSGCGGILADIPYEAYTASDPPAGEWTVAIDGPTDAAYFLVVAVESPLRVTLHGMPDEPVIPGRTLKLSAEVNYPFGQTSIRRIESHLDRSLPGQDRIDADEVTSNNGPILVHVPAEEGIYVISTTVTGEMPDGTSFERSFVRSFAAVKPETLRKGPTLLIGDDGFRE